jgi:hypothetical protein
MSAGTVPGRWQKSSYSGPDDGNNCIELATTPGTIHLRESDTPGTRIATAPSPLAHLLHGIRSGRLGRTSRLSP